MTGLLRRLRARLRNRRFNADLAEELRLHEEMKREELAAMGLSADDARAAARRAMGNVTLMREDARRVWIGRWLEILNGIRATVARAARGRGAGADRGRASRSVHGFPVHARCRAAG